MALLLLVVLDVMTPAAREAFVLHDVLWRMFPELGDTGRSPGQKRR